MTGSKKGSSFTQTARFEFKKKLGKVTRGLDEDHKSRLKAKTVAQAATQLKEFVEKLEGLQTEHQTLKIHTRTSEILLSLTKTKVVNKSLKVQQNLAARGALQRNVVLRPLCLASITSGGIKPRVLEKYCNHMVTIV
ncbi:hypothetical protein Clacol_001990 [Clathrus columnatus]|uniref:Uncharacterized protein n=1 Tax=Clathrus columnatus TaxID=1419009 RepID=A0AAV5A0L1_9AGAM|nr:hypothetical protein Clacol_001990 [Clathrus columnatus]